ncbi:hypothetical protein OC834_005049 [Tilletia horrida]|uniref:Uncharacterized protein n=1 Tax=Tilletia horrida TaxID=155126 RepID=A0AAN6JIC8_9BASI|nr:hypothetical protein OC842_005518 [Tilletia horrida]KAK0525740.1 hypothetical protein OC834_005049 [Tilletia horrida]KAK0531687.1 hypothetical protein OC835_003587 [Tilletia horrida]KAK0559402.1 hypothetical protein OC844_004433 [Tilletia horrida]
MSFRFHFTKPMLSLFHDPSNPASQRALALVKAAARNPPPSIARATSSSNPADTSSPSSASASVSSPDAPKRDEAEVDRYLREAAASPQDASYSTLYDIEVVDNQPTSDQLRTIRDTVKLGNVSREDAMLLGLKQDDLANDVLLVDWDNNRSATNLRGVQELLAELHRERGKAPKQDGAQSGGGGGCTIM